MLISLQTADGLPAPRILTDGSLMKDLDMRFSFKTATCLLAGCCVMQSAMALDNSVKPEVTAPLASSPKIALLIGNSYSFYNCGVHTYLRGMMHNGTPVEKMKTRLLTISAGSLSYHDVGYYLQPHEQDPYAIVKDGKLTKPMFDVVLLQGHSAAATSDKRLPLFEKYALAHAETIRNASSTPLLIMTWAKQDKPEEIGKLADNTIRIANKAHMRVVPVGLAFSEVRKLKPELVLHMPDKSHPTAAGTYLYGAVLYSVLFHRSPADINYLGECEKPLPNETAAFLREIAWKTVTDFYGWK